MIKIFDIKCSEKIVKSHWKNLEPILKVRITEELGKLDATSDMAEIKIFRALLEKNGRLSVKKIITGTPDKLMEIYNEILKNYNYYEDGQVIFTSEGLTNQKKADKTAYGSKIREGLKRIFDYDNFSKKNMEWNAYSLCEKLDVRICPYCNQQFTFTIIEDDAEIMRPELDHYFPKADYPMFALSIYNLIPSCHGCNSTVKGIRKMKLTEHFHPYIDEDKAFSFRYDIEEIDDTLKTDIRFEYSGNAKAKDTCEFFKLDKIYSEHTWITDKIVQTKNDYPQSYVEELLNIIKKVKPETTKEDIIKMVYASYYVDDENKEILGKLKKDILSQVIEQYKF